MDSDDSDTSNVRYNRRIASHNQRLFNASSDNEDGQPIAGAPAAAKRLAATKPTRAAPRFLGDEDDDEAGRSVNPMIDDLFADLDDIPAFNQAKDRPRGGPRATARDASKTTRTNNDASASNAAAAATVDDDDPWGIEGGDGQDLVGGIVGDGDADGIGGKKARRPVAKMDDARLLGPAGFPKLLDQIQTYKVKGGKGDELKELKRVLRMYQLWCHQMYPKTNLRDTLRMVEKLCHRRSVQSALRTYRDDIKKASQPAPPPDVDADGAPDQDGQEFDRAHGLSSPGAAPTRISGDQVFADMTNERGASVDSWDDDAFEAMFAKEDEILGDLQEAAIGAGEAGERLELTQSTVVPEKTSNGASEQDQDVPDDLDEDDWMDEEAEAAMRELNG